MSENIPGDICSTPSRYARCDLTTHHSQMCPHEHGDALLGSEVQVSSSDRRSEALEEALSRALAGRRRRRPWDLE
jgi:hypothetical protein